jgi:hypothetical protein
MCVPFLKKKKDEILDEIWDAIPEAHLVGFISPKIPLWLDDHYDCGPLLEKQSLRWLRPCNRRKDASYK